MKSYATRYHFIDDLVTMCALDAIVATLKSIVDYEIIDDIVPCGIAYKAVHRRPLSGDRHLTRM